MFGVPSPDQENRHGQEVITHSLRVPVSKDLAAALAGGSGPCLLGGRTPDFAWTALCQSRSFVVLGPGKGRA